MLKELLEGMTKDEIISLVIAYNDYLFLDHEDEFNRIDRAPVFISALDTARKNISRHCQPSPNSYRLSIHVPGPQNPAPLLALEAI